MLQKLEPAPETIKHVPLPFHDVLLKDHHHLELALPGGYGSGKTWFAVLWHHTRCQMNVGCESIWLAPDYAICRVGFRCYLDMLEKWGFVENVHYRVTRSAGNMTIYYVIFDHTIYFLTSNQTIQGWTCSHATVDECGDCIEEGVKNTVNRVRDVNARVRQKLFTGAPQGLNHYFKRFSDPGKTVTGQFGQFRHDDTQLILHYRSYWNKYYPEPELRELFKEYGHDEQFIKSWVFGLFVPLSQNACFKFDDQTNISNRELSPNNYQVFVGWDFNVGQIAFVGLQQFDGEWHAVFEAPNKIHDTDDACSELIRILPPHKYGNHRIVIDGDANGHSGSTRGKQTDYDIIITRLREHYPRLEIIAPHHNTGVQHRVMSTNRLFGNKRLYINRSLKYLIEGLSVTTWDNHGGIKKGSKDTWSHRPDALSYVVSRQEPMVQKGFIGGTKF